MERIWCRPSLFSRAVNYLLINESHNVIQEMEILLCLSPSHPVYWLGLSQNPIGYIIMKETDSREESNSLLSSENEVLYADRFSCGQVNGLRRLLVEELVEEADVCERPSGHHSVVPSTGAVWVVVPRSQTGQNTNGVKPKGFTH